MRNIIFVYDETTRMSADIYTKSFTDRIRWTHACNLFQIINQTTILTLMVSDALSHETPPSCEGGGGGVSAMTNCKSSDDENSSTMPAVFVLERRRSSKSPLAKVGPLSHGVHQCKPLLYT